MVTLFFDLPHFHFLFFSFGYAAFIRFKSVTCSCSYKEWFSRMRFQCNKEKEIRKPYVPIQVRAPYTTDYITKKVSCQYYFPFPKYRTLYIQILVVRGWEKANGNWISTKLLRHVHSRICRYLDNFDDATCAYFAIWNYTVYQHNDRLCFGAAFSIPEGLSRNNHSSNVQFYLSEPSCSLSLLCVFVVSNLRSAKHRHWKWEKSILVVTVCGITIGITTPNNLSISIKTPSSPTLDVWLLTLSSLKQWKTFPNNTPI